MNSEHIGGLDDLEAIAGTDDAVTVNIGQTVLKLRPFRPFGINGAAPFRVLHDVMRMMDAPTFAAASTTGKIPVTDAIELFDRFFSDNTKLQNAVKALDHFGIGRADLERANPAEILVAVGRIFRMNHDFFMQALTKVQGEMSAQKESR